MSISIKKIFHRNAYRIGITFDYNEEIKSTLKSIGALYSKSHGCWYINYDAASYAELKKHFSSFEIEKTPESSVVVTQPVTDSSRDLSPIATSELQLGSSQLSNPAHKTDILFAQKLRLQLLENIGKYWVF
jgi:hypothetical protein